jgi:hypothetical protein
MHFSVGTLLCLENKGNEIQYVENKQLPLFITEVPFFSLETVRPIVLFSRDPCPYSWRIYFYSTGNRSGEACVAPAGADQLRPGSGVPGDVQQRSHHPCHTQTVQVSRLLLHLLLQRHILSNVSIFNCVVGVFKVFCSILHIFCQKLTCQTLLIYFIFIFLTNATATALLLCY